MKEIDRTNWAKKTKKREGRTDNLEGIYTQKKIQKIEMGGGEKGESDFRGKNGRN